MGDPVVHWPRGVEGDAETVTAVIDRSDQQSQFMPTIGAGSSKEPHSIIVSLALTVTVTTAAEPINASVFILEDGTKWWARRMLGIDGGEQDILAQRNGMVHTQRGSKT